MPLDEPLSIGQSNLYKSDAGGATLIKEPVVGVVKNNIDPSRSGRIQVYIAKLGGSNPDDSSSWTTVSYLSPFSGIAGLSGTQGTGGQTDGYGKFVGNPQSYGFWASAPDIGTEVICIFINGDVQNGFYIGCIPKAGLLAMTPAIGSTTSVVPNSAESKTYGGADRLPTSEVNIANPNLANSVTAASDPKPIHSYQAAILFNQGLIRDNNRGVISSSAQRESPSRVFGISTPGGPVYTGGYTNSTIAEAAKSGTDSKLQIVGRTGGHSLVMDDGGLQGEDTLMRLRSSAGHMIMMSDSAQTLFIIHANGQSWIELGKEGTIDMYATNSVNIRTEGDLNLHADRDLNLHAAKNLRMYADNIMMETDTNTTIRTGADFAQQVIGKYTVKVTGDLSLASSGAASLAAKGSAYINGDKVNLNTGNTGTTPGDVPVMPKTNHPDTAYSTDKGWIYPAPDALLSVTSRAPAHQPWVGSNKGVDVKVNNVVKSGAPTTTTQLDATNNAVPNVPKKASTPTVNATVPPQKATQSVVPGMDSGAVTALTGQQAVSNSTQPTGSKPVKAVGGPTTGATRNPTITESGAVVPQYVAPPDTKRGDGIMQGPGGMTLEQACGPGMVIKPGSEQMLAQRLAQGMPYDKAMQGLVTGNLGATNVTQALNSAIVQTKVVSASINNATASLFNSGLLTGQESAGQAGGVVLAAAKYGTNVVSSAVSGIQNAISNTVTGTVNSVAGAVTGVAQGVTNTIAGAIGTATSIANGVQGAVAKAGQIADSISAGKFSGMMSDGLTSGLSGLANSVTGAIKNAIGGALSSVTSLASMLTGTLRNAFNTIEASYKNLTASAPNILGDKSAAASSVDLTTNSSKYNTAKVAVDEAQKSYDTAMAAYRTNPDDINKAAMDSAEKQLSQARQAAASAAGSMLTGGVGSLVSGATNAIKSATSGITSGISSVANSISSAVSNPVTTQNSGPNALPGGVGAMVNQVTDTGTNTINTVKNSLASVTNNPVGSVLDPTKLAGNLVSGTTNAITSTVSNVASAATGAVTGAVNAVTGIVSGAVNAVTGTIKAIANLPAQILGSIAATANGIISTIQTTLASIGNMSGQIKAAINATNTFNKTPMVAKTGQLMGDPAVPTPQSMTATQSDAPPVKSTPSVDSQIDAKAKAAAAVKDAQESVDAQKQRIAEGFVREGEDPNSKQAQFYEGMAKEQLAAKEKKLADAQAKYQAIVSGENSAPST